MSYRKSAPRASNTGAFLQLLAPILRLAHRRAMALTANPADAQDLVQEASFLAFRDFDSFRPGTNFPAWFCRIVLNCFRSDLRRQRQKPLRVVPDPGDRLVKADLWQGSPWPDPVSYVLERSLAEEVAAALLGLPVPYRQAATLYFFDDLSYKQIAVELRCPIGTVRSRLHRSRKYLQQRLRHLDPAGDSRERQPVRGLVEWC